MMKFILLLSSLFFLQACSQDPTIERIKGGTFNECGKATIGDLVDNFFSSPSWEAIDATDGKNYVEGDVGVKIENVNFYFPLQFNLRYKRGWREDGEHAPHANDYILFITDPDLCAAFSPVGEIEDRIGQETRQFKDALGLKNTLKQFLDDWPGGKDLIPAQDIQRMTKTIKKSTTPKGVIDSIPDDLKESMNEVLLTNKLLGD